MGFKEMLYKDSDVNFYRKGRKVFAKRRKAWFVAVLIMQSCGINRYRDVRLHQLYKKSAK
ncbi:hypothetical protein BC343_26615 [Mucilaginibacter pedocola]|uniref:Uncharacterized protein n=1 Tax=Mucilaginibacter pedocola TaxID=1792845 RepID=A0A1S9PGL5_9SPHI|nr:hypothetical protein BC343_26615 [Mucilaginibacter pedocola]